MLKAQYGTESTCRTGSRRPSDCTRRVTLSTGREASCPGVTPTPHRSASAAPSVTVNDRGCPSHRSTVRSIRPNSAAHPHGRGPLDVDVAAVPDPRLALGKRTAARGAGESTGIRRRDLRPRRRFGERRGARQAGARSLQGVRCWAGLRRRPAGPPPYTRRARSAVRSPQSRFGSTKPDQLQARRPRPRARGDVADRLCTTLVVTCRLQVESPCLPVLVHPLAVRAWPCR